MIIRLNSEVKTSLFSVIVFPVDVPLVSYLGLANSSNNVIAKSLPMKSSAGENWSGTCIRILISPHQMNCCRGMLVVVKFGDRCLLHRQVYIFRVTMIS